MSFDTSPTEAPKRNLLRIEDDLSRVRPGQARTHVDHLGRRELARRYDRAYTLFYPDQPYWVTEGYGVDFSLEQYDQSAGLMRTMKDGWTSR